MSGSLDFVQKWAMESEKSPFFPHSENLTSKKPKNITQPPVLQQNLQYNNPSDATVRPSTTEEHSHIHEGKQVKPIFINSNIQVIKNVLNAAQLTSRPICKVRSSQSTQVLCLNLEDKKKLIEKLKSQKLGYHTYTDPAEKPRSFILKGFYHTDCQELLKLLNEAGARASKVIDFIRKDEYVMYLVQFQSPVNINQLNHDFKLIDYISVKWENLKKSSNKATQCYNCQEWGHASINCGRTPRCVKCINNHPKGECPRITREDDAKCCNCGGSHSANHRGCTAYKKHIERLSVRRKIKTNVSNSIELTSPKQFPKLPKQPISRRLESVENSTLSSHISYAEKLQEAVKVEGLYKKLTDAQEKLKKIPGIGRTINDFCNFVDELAASPNTNSARFKVILKYQKEEYEENQESEEDDDGITDNEDGSYTKWKRRQGTEWFSVGRIEDLTESEKLKMTKNSDETDEGMEEETANMTEWATYEGKKIPVIYKHNN